MIQLAWLIPLLPLIGFLIIGFGGKKLSKNLVSIVGCGSILAAFIVTLGIFFQLHGTSQVVKLSDWINTGNLHIDFSFTIDPLSVLFMLIITGIGFLIHVYSTGYMHDDEKYDRFFCYLNLFVFFMLLLVMGSNYIVMFVGWEGVGLCSYLLIGFWFKNTDYNNAAKKAFIVNRIGDLGFLLGMILIYVTYHSLNFDKVFGQVHAADKNILNLIGILLFIGACGKSAQIPLYTWLPDAMAGPTPVSALIHAATMVTAGVYMIARSSIIFVNAPGASEVVAIVGLLTALFAATIGLFQNDIKKVLAYSTVSQLGYMFLGLGVGAFTGGVFHVMTHAFFKALLFLGAGSVIHAMGGEQDIRKMGGLKKSLPITHITFLIATIAISGIPPFAGFFSKDEILSHVYNADNVLGNYAGFFWVLGVVGSILTAFYMFRLYYLTFHGKFRGTHDQEHHLHESPKSMTVPLVVLAILSVVGGFVGIPNGRMHLLHSFLQPSFGFTVEGEVEKFSWDEARLMIIAVLAAGAAIYTAWYVYKKNNMIPIADEKNMPKYQRVIYHKYYVDEIYNAIIRKPLDWCSDFFYKFLELKVVDGFVNGVGSVVKWTGGVVRYAQSGNIGLYMFFMTIAVIVMLLVKLH